MYYIRIEIAMVQFYYGLNHEPVDSIDDAWVWFESEIDGAFKRIVAARPESKRRYSIVHKPLIEHCVQSLCAL